MSDTTESSGDEWEETLPSGPILVQDVPIVTWNTLNTFVYQKKDYKYYNGLACTLPLVNFGLTSDARTVIHRCEPLKDPATGQKHYPTVTLPHDMKAYSHVFLTMVLFHPNCAHVRVRFPDLKDKVEQHRSEQGLWINTNDGPFRMKKKAVDKGTKEDVGYRLGADFKFHTPGIEPTFIMVATPCDVSGLLVDKAVRSEHFLVHSKRQEQPGPRKRRKKAKEISKLETDIAASRNEKQLLHHEDMRLNYVNTKHGRFLRYLKKKLKTSIKDTTVGIALHHAVRPVHVDEMVAL